MTHLLMGLCNAVLGAICGWQAAITLARACNKKAARGHWRHNF